MGKVQKFDQNSNTPVIAGVEITTDGEGRINLNSLHKASGGAKKDGPSYWFALDSTQDLVQEFDRQTTGISVVKKEGRNGGTFAAEELAVSYAGWISPAFQLEVNRTFIAARKGQNETMPATLSGPQLMAAALIEADATMKAQAQQIEDMREDVEALGRISSADGSLSITEAAKGLGVRPRDLFNWLSQNGWIYKRNGAGAWLGYSSKCNYGLLEHKTTTVLRADGSEKVTEQVRITAKGITRLAKLIPGVAKEVK